MPHPTNGDSGDGVMEITSEIVREFLHYDPDTGIFTWRHRDIRWFKHKRAFKMWHTRYAGKRAGRVATYKNGYECRVIRMFKSPVFEHRIAWLYVSDDPLPESIDHINRDATDNRWCNIRPSSRLENSKNLSMKHNNRSGFTGVDWHGASGSWRARCWANGKRHSIGYFKSANDANEAAVEFRRRHGYDHGHGAELAHYRK